jgi:DivIVA domain-containing protein
MTEAASQLTPEGIRQLQLQKTFRGYDTGAVDRLLQELAQSLESMTTERSELQAEVAGLEKELAEHRDAQGLMQDALFSAQRAAEELRQRTQRECDEILAKARADAVELESRTAIERERAEADLELVRRQERELRASYKVLLHAALDRLGEGAEEAQVKPTLLDALAPRRVIDEGSPAESPPPTTESPPPTTES